MAAPAARFGNYELERRLGAGGMAETFFAVKRGPGDFEQHVCLKRILPAFETDAEFVRLFNVEAKIAAKLRHANIVQVIDYGVADGSHYLALELVDGLDLRLTLRALGDHGEKLPAPLVALLAQELAIALDFAHDATETGQVKGVIHRDISPSNVLLSTAGEIKLADFGIAKAMSLPGVTRSGIVKGKVPYMAPEYARLGHFDARSDLFSLGVTLYESLGGQRPYQGVTDIDTLEKMSQGVFTPLVQLAPTAPQILIDIIERLIHPDPSWRPANATVLLDALTHVAPPPTARRALADLVRRAKAASAATAHEPSAQVALAPTLAATPSGTGVLPEAQSAPIAGADTVKVADPSAPTRTRPKAPASERPSAKQALMTPLPMASSGDTVRSHITTRKRERVDLGFIKPRIPLAGWIGAGVLAALAVGVAAAFVGAVSQDPSQHQSPSTRTPGPEVVPPVGTAVARPVGASSALHQPAAADLQPPPASNEAATHTNPTDTDRALPESDRDSEEDSDDEGDRSRRRARVLIEMEPWGDVIVDGHNHGPAPQMVRLSAGTHRLSSSNPNIRTTRFEVTAGESRRISLR